MCFHAGNLKGCLTAAPCQSVAACTIISGNLQACRRSEPFLPGLGRGAHHAEATRQVKRPNAFVQISWRHLRVREAIVNIGVLHVCDDSETKASSTSLLACSRRIANFTLPTALHCAVLAPVGRPRERISASCRRCPRNQARTGACAHDSVSTRQLLTTA